MSPVRYNTQFLCPSSGTNRKHVRDATLTAMTARSSQLRGRITMDTPHFRADNEEGAATAEYAIATMAAVGFAGLLVVIMRSDEVRQILTDLVRSALTFSG